MLHVSRIPLPKTKMVYHRDEAAMLEREFQYYKAHEGELVERHKGKFIAIVGEDVVGAFDTELEAYLGMKAKYGLGNFLLQECLPGTDNHVQRYHSRVAFR